MGKFIPGGIWLDTDGKRIQAHGGSVICIKSLPYILKIAWTDRISFTTKKEKNLSVGSKSWKRMEVRVKRFWKQTIY